jgi:hypothetical protein
MKDGSSSKANLRIAAPRLTKRRLCPVIDHPAYAHNCIQEGQSNKDVTNRQ